MTLMETLSAAFLAELAEAVNSGEPSVRSKTDPALEMDLVAACARGRAAFPGLVLDDQTFVKHLARAAKTGGGTLDAFPQLVIEDLFLCCACLAGADGAAAAFHARHGATIRGTIARIVRGADNGEVEQQLVAGLLVGSVAGPARIGTYAGKAPLDRWLGVAAQRAALMWLRENRTEARARDGAAAEPAPGGHTHPEMAFLKDRYRGDFEGALKESLTRLPERQRTLLRLHLVNGVSVEKIGQMFAVSQPTASRWLAAAERPCSTTSRRPWGTGSAPPRRSSPRWPEWSPAGSI